jgi:hypothetical protein
VKGEWEGVKGEGGRGREGERREGGREEGVVSLFSVGASFPDAGISVLYVGGRCRPWAVVVVRGRVVSVRCVAWSGVGCVAVSFGWSRGGCVAVSYLGGRVVVGSSRCWVVVLWSRSSLRVGFRVVVSLTVVVSINETTMNDDKCRRSSFGCHVAVSDVAP